MHVVEDMLLAVAVVARALGAVAELHVGVVRVCLAADAALVGVALLPLLLPDRFAELDRLGSAVGLDLVGLPLEHGGEEHEQVQQGHDGHEGHPPQPEHGVADHADGVERRLEPGHPFHFDGDDVVDPDHGVGVVQGVGEKERGVDVGGPVDRHGDPVDQIGQDRGQSRQQRAAEIVDGEFGAAPVPLQSLPQPVVEETREQQPDAAAGGQKNKGDDPPDLALEHGGGVHGQKAQAAPGEQIQKIDDHVGAHDIAHQPRQGETGMQGAEAVNGVAQLSQGKIPPVLLLW